jgi:NAD(P)-dependent dehydrogenase (short-subunit alcohol dehydrogenase family)
LPADVSPAAVRTPIQAKFGLPSEVRALVEQSYTACIPLQRLGEAREVAGLALFLASEAASYMTGTEIQVDGGLLVA